MNTQCTIFDDHLEIADIQARFDSGETTPVELVQFYLQKIAEHDHGEKGINAVLELNPDAVFIAESLDARRRDGLPVGPLHGIPVLLKDNIDTGDRMHTSAGTYALRHSHAPRDAFIVAQLRRAGAIILGKVNLTEMANFMTRGMPNGYSSRGGQVLNPYGPGTLDVGGSSSGSAAAVAANLATVAVGTETSGSILSPASQNSLVGIKPTVGLVSRTGIIPISHSQDTAGPLARSVADAAALLGAMTGRDEDDPATWTSVDRGYTDYTQFLQPDALDGSRIGIARGEFFERLSEAELSLMERAINVMATCGAELVDPAPLNTGDTERKSPVLFYEFKSGLNAYLAKLGPGAPVRTLGELIDYNSRHSQVTLKYGQSVLVKSDETSGTLTEPEYILGRERDLRSSRDEGIDLTMQRYDLDALVFPGSYGASMPARAGYPSVSVPAGYAEDGKPLGVTFTGRAYSEPRLIALAFSFENATDYRIPPELS